MTIKRVGFASQLTNGVWGPVFATAEQAQRWALERRAEVDSARVALELLADLPDGPPRPTVSLASGERVRYNLNRNQFVILPAVGANVTVSSVVEIIRLFSVTDAEVDALQALPTDTAAWAAAGGRD